MSNSNCDPVADNIKYSTVDAEKPNHHYETIRYRYRRAKLASVPESFTSNDKQIKFSLSDI